MELYGKDEEHTIVEGIAWKGANSVEKWLMAVEVGKTCTIFRMAHGGL